MIRFVVVAVLMVSVLTLGSAPSWAVCEGSAEAAGDALVTEVDCAIDGQEGQGQTVEAQNETEPRYASYVWASVCAQFAASEEPSSRYLDCAAARNCANPDERVWQLWGERLPPEEGWELLGSQCFGVTEPPAGVQPTVTPAVVLEAIRRIGLPAVEVVTQPADKTLVNFETIFYTQPQTFTSSLTLLGQQVDVEATPVKFQWHHGDGTVATTTTPGAPYPAKEITYSYVDAHVTVETRVDVTYAARFRVNGGAWQNIAETVTIVGPASPLRVAEAVPVLSGDYS